MINATPLNLVCHLAAALRLDHVPLKLRQFRSGPEQAPSRSLNHIHRKTESFMGVLPGTGCERRGRKAWLNLDAAAGGCGCTC